LEKQAQVMAEYSQQYEQRKLTIGTIKCTQCEWSGQWGTGMTYEQFFAGNLAESGIDVARRAVNNDNLSGDNRQYTCPVCNSSGWEKA
jgi:transcription elongation factor Elf1